MPIPNPKKNEAQNSFMSRCMHVIGGENKPQEQKVAICLSQFRRAKKDGEESGLAEENGLANALIAAQTALPHGQYALILSALAQGAAAIEQLQAKPEPQQEPQVQPEQPETIAAKIHKSDEEKRVVYSVVLDPYQVDAQGDWISPADVQKTAWDFVKTSRKIGLSHDATKTPDAHVVESWLVHYPDGEYAKAMRGEVHKIHEIPFGNDKIRSGSWVMGIQLGEKEWADYKSGEIDAVSIGGFGQRLPVSRAELPQFEVI